MLISFPLGIDAKARLLDNMGILPLRFVRSVLVMVTLTYNSVDHAQVFAFIHILTNTYSFVLLTIAF